MRLTFLCMQLLWWIVKKINWLLMQKMIKTWTEQPSNRFEKSTCLYGTLHAVRRTHMPGGLWLVDGFWQGCYVTQPRAEWRSVSGSFVSKQETPRVRGQELNLERRESFAGNNRSERRHAVRAEAEQIEVQAEEFECECRFFFEGEHHKIWTCNR